MTHASPPSRALNDPVPHPRWVPVGILLRLIAVAAIITLSGCIGAPTGDEMSHGWRGNQSSGEQGHEFESINRNNTFNAWEKSFDIKHYAPLRICIFEACAINQFEYEPVKISQRNGTIVGMNAVIDWSEGSNPSIQEREVTIWCIGKSSGECNSPFMQTYNGKSPIHITISQMLVQSNETILVDVQIADPTPSAMAMHVDGKNQYSLKGSLIVVEGKE